MRNEGNAERISYVVNPVLIGDRSVGPQLPCLVIAEAGVNHNGSVDMALRLVDAAAEAGADVVKFQTFKSEEVVSPVAPKAIYQSRTTGVSESQLAMVKKLELTDRCVLAKFERHCRQRGIVFMSTPFDNGSVDLLQKLGVVAFKVGSGELTNLPFLTYVAAKGKPLILSTGMGNLDEVTAAVETVRAAGNRDLVLLHCVSNYPASASSVNLHAMKTLEERVPAFQLAIQTTPRASKFRWRPRPLGRASSRSTLRLIEALPGPDHQASLGPNELEAMTIRNPHGRIRAGRRTEAAGTRRAKHRRCSPPQSIGCL